MNQHHEAAGTSPQQPASSHQQPQTALPHQALHPSTDLAEYFRQYARERPEVVALWCLGVGFVLGWKLKPW